MRINQHALARTTPATRKAMQESTASSAWLARRYGISISTVYKWRKATTIIDGSHTRHNRGPRQTPMEEAMIKELRLAAVIAKRYYRSVAALFRENFQRQFYVPLLQKIRYI